jgi:hypothetical protein
MEAKKCGGSSEFQQALVGGVALPSSKSIGNL